MHQKQFVQLSEITGLALKCKRCGASLTIPIEGAYKARFVRCQVYADDPGPNSDAAWLTAVVELGKAISMIEDAQAEEANSIGFRLSLELGSENEIDTENCPACVERMDAEIQAEYAAEEARARAWQTAKKKE